MIRLGVFDRDNMTVTLTMTTGDFDALHRDVRISDLNWKREEERDGRPNVFLADLRADTKANLKELDKALEDMRAQVKAEDEAKRAARATA